MTATDSILSFPERGPWGDPGYRGNCSGYVYREVFEHLHPRVFIDPMAGSGPSVEVAREMRNCRLIHDETAAISVRASEKTR